MKKITLSFILIFVISIPSLYSQYKTQILKQNQNIERFNNYQKINSFTPSVGLGIQAGFARFESTGLGVGMFAEIKTESFSLVPMAYYWKVDKMNNFEMCGLARLRFSTGSMEPYVDGGIGLNFLNDKRDPTSEKNDTKIGLDLGGGIDFVGVGANYSLFFDAKYKIIVGDPNIKGVIFGGGIKFSL
ncbi:MAG: hypothetical protein WC358_07965 [Ignavibacteria bacterium]|jgi:opacity protein-like surface antigen